MHSVANTVRWKWKDGTHGEPVRRSNARVIRWSDGTASLMVGQEMWDLQVDSVAGSGPEAKATRPFALARVAAEAKAKAEANQDGSQSQSQSQSQFLASQSSQPKLAADGSIAKPRATREGPVSLLLSTDFDDQVLIADSLITGSMSLVPQTRNVRDHQKRLAAVSKSTVKASRIQAYRDSSGIRPDKKIEESVREMNEAQKKRMKARGHDVNAGLSLPVWKGSSGTMRERETSPLGAAGGRKSRGPSGPRKGRTSYSSDEDMDDDGGRGGGGGYTGGDYEEDDFVVSSSSTTPEQRRGELLTSLFHSASRSTTMKTNEPINPVPKFLRPNPMVFPPSTEIWIGRNVAIDHRGQASLSAPRRVRGIMRATRMTIPWMLWRGLPRRMHRLSGVRQRRGGRGKRRDRRRSGPVCLDGSGQERPG